jgi:hypothetical protein
VFERLDLALVQELLGAATGSGDELRTVTFDNQIVESGSVPDARISARFTWWFETKTERGAYAGEGHGRRQLREHSRLLVGDPDALLFVLTPDMSRPPWLDELDGVAEDARPRVLWLSFRDLAEQMRGFIADSTRLLGEQSRFLLDELVALYEADGLLTVDDTVVVAARAAWPEYQQHSAYICQPDRAFGDGLTHFGFYAGGVIQPTVARIRAHYPSVRFTREEAAALRSRRELELADVIDRFLQLGLRSEGDAHGVLLLSPPDDPETEYLEAPVVNDTKTAAGRTWAVQQVGQAAGVGPATPPLLRRVGSDQVVRPHQPGHTTSGDAVAAAAQLAVDAWHAVGVARR